MRFLRLERRKNNCLKNLYLFLPHSLRGSSNVNVLVNGKPSPLSTSELLLEIPSSTIAKIEIITSPSAKYQANGLTGIINIITNKKVQKGLSLNTNLNANSLGGYGTNLGMKYGLSKINYRIGTSYRKNIFKNSNSQIRSGIRPFEQVADFEFNGDIYKINGGIDWFVTENDEISVSANYTDNGHNLNTEANIIEDNIQTPQDVFGQHSHKTLSANGNYRHYFQERKAFLELDA